MFEFFEFFAVHSCTLPRELASTVNPEPLEGPARNIYGGTADALLYL